MRVAGHDDGVVGHDRLLGRVMASGEQPRRLQSSGMGMKTEQAALLENIDLIARHRGHSLKAAVHRPHFTPGVEVKTAQPRGAGKPGEVSGEDGHAVRRLGAGRLLP